VAKLDYLDFVYEIQAYKKVSQTRMWANAQHDGCPAKYRWCRLLNAAVWLLPTARVPCSKAANIGEQKIWTQSEFCTWQNSVRGQEPLKMHI